MMKRAMPLDTDRLDKLVVELRDVLKHPLTRLCYDAAAALTQLRQRVAELEQITDRLDADLATSDGHREAAETRLAAVERERDEAQALVKAIDEQREEYHWARKNAERERDEARATICTTDVRQELERLTTKIAVAFHFVHDGQERNYALNETMKECGALIEASFVLIAGPYYNALTASKAKVLALTHLLKAARYHVDSERDISLLVAIDAALQMEGKSDE